MSTPEEIKQMEAQFAKQEVICNVCEENLGRYRAYYAQEHMEKYPDHTSHRIVNI